MFSGGREFSTNLTTLPPTDVHIPLKGGDAAERLSELVKATVSFGAVPLIGNVRLPKSYDLSGAIAGMGGKHS